MQQTTFRAVNPADGGALDPPFAEATGDDVASAVDAATAAFRG